MVDHDLPRSIGDFDRWVADRVLAPSATLHHEATTLLAEDPTLTGSSSIVHHAILGAIANGSVTAGTIARRLGKTVSNLTPALNRLVDAGFVTRHLDPIRAQRPRYALADPYLQFHYAVLEPHRAELRDRSPLAAWSRGLRDTFSSRVRGPVFEEQARTWIRRYAGADVFGGTYPEHVGPSTVSFAGGDHEVDVIVAGAGEEPSARPVLAIGEAKAGATLGVGHLRRLEDVRAALTVRASRARLLLFGVAFAEELRLEAGRRADVDLIDLDRLHHGR